MPGSFFALLDDLATLLDDVAVLTKIAAKKTAGVVGDDLALNAQQVAGVAADRELPVVYAVAKGSLLNKAILIPAALGISAALPVAVTPLMMIGGAYLCFEGVEKLAHKAFHSKDEDEAHDAGMRDALADEAVDVLAFEKEKVKGAIRTDFILSAEIIVLSLGVVASAPFAQQVVALSLVGVAMTVGVYGLVAGIVKLDDLGLHLSRRGIAAGRAILVAAPWLMKGLSVAGTAAMFLVGGEILVHGVAPLHHWLEHALPSGVLGDALGMLAHGGFGVVCGAIVLALVTAVKRIVSRVRGRATDPGTRV